MPSYADPPPDFLDAISNSPNGRRLSTSTATSATSSAGTPSNFALPLGAPIPSPSPSPRRWDDPPEHEPEGPAENTTTLLLVHQRRVLASATRREVLQLDFTPVGTHVAVATTYSASHLHADDYKTVCFYETRTWAPVSPLNLPKLQGGYALAPGRPVIALSFFTDHVNSYNSGATHTHLEVYDLLTRSRLVKGNSSVPVQSPLAYSPDGATLAGVHSRDRSRIVLVKPTQDPPQVLRIIATHMGDVTKLAFAPDGTAVISASKDGSLRMTSVTSGRTLWRFEVPITRFNCTMMRVSPDGKVVVSVWGRDVHLWYPLTGGMNGYNLNAVRRTEGWPLCISPDCKYLACRTEEGFDVSNVKDGLFRGEFAAEGTLVTAAAFSNDSRWMLVGKFTGDVHLFEVVT